VKISKHGLNYWMDLRVRGKRVRRSLGTDEYYLALDKARQIAEELRRPKPAGTDIAEFFEKYRAWARETKPASYKTEDGRLKFMGAWLDKAGLSSFEVITPWHVEQLRAAVTGRVIGKRTGRTAGRPTANRYLALLRNVINKAIEWGVFTGTNPVSKVKFYRESPDIRPLSDEDITAIMGAARVIAGDPQSDCQRLLPDLLTLALNTGLRRSELIFLRWRDVQGEEIAVRGKGNKRRTIPLNRAAYDVIMRQPKEGEFVFSICNRHQPDLFRRTVKRLRKLSGVADFHLHLTRHKFATDLIRAGVDIVTVSALLGHSAAMTTLLYAHPSAESKRKAISLLRPVECDLRAEQEKVSRSTYNA